ncbi:MAG: AAA family ATPase, partial [Anaerolineales bacterium]|nr:AAA family ATPase [Anaerolineales bacterium]
MIPVKLQLTNFLSYQNTAVLDFEGLHLAGIAGLNGAGKSSIIDGMTWALFGKSRSKSDDDVVNRRAVRNEDTAEIIFDFELDGQIYRIIRRKRQRRAMVVELQVAVDYAQDEWKSLTRAKRRETDTAVEELLRMNYDTFTNASFLLQGQADEFTTKTSGQRKEILADLLGVNDWERYREAAANRRKAEESTQTLLEGQLGEIERELAEEPARRTALETAQGERDRVSRELT